MQKVGESMLERILIRDNLNLAYKRVKANKGSHGVDKMTIDEILPFLKQHGETIRKAILEGNYTPQPVRRVEIPKPDGGVRQLGIPAVLDRFIQQAIKAARGYIEQGYQWTVDIDLEKFFDKVNHDKLMSLVARKVKDKRVLKLIRKYLESGIMLDELDKELEKRGDRFCRYTDDCNIYVRSRKAGENFWDFHST